MPARLRQLSQDWASLAVRGFDKSAQAEIDKNDRERAQLQGIGNVVASGIVRKKGRERQDKLLAEERARDDKIRAERYGREDAREAKEEARYNQSRQAERDILALKWTQGEKARLTAEMKNAGSPEAQQAIMAQYQEIVGRESALTQRLMGPQQQAATATGQQYAARFGTNPNDEDTPLTAQEQAAMTPGAPDARTARGAPMPAPMEGYVSVLGQKLAASPPAPATGKVPAPGVAATPAPAPPADLAFLTPSGKKAVEKSTEAAALAERYSRLDRAAKELQQRIDNATSPAGIPQMRARYNALLDEAGRAREDAARAGELAQMLEAAGRQELAEQSKKAALASELRNSAAFAKNRGPRATGAFLKAWMDGVRDPQKLDAITLGALTAAEAERALAEKRAAQLTPAQEEAQAARKGTLAGITEKAKDAANPDPAKPDTLAKSALAKYARQTANYGFGVNPHRWDVFAEDELKAVAADEGVDPVIRQKFYEAWEARVDPKGLGDPEDGAAPAAAYPSWLQPEAKSDWDRLSPEAKAKVLKAKGR